MNERILDIEDKICSCRRENSTEEMKIVDYNKDFVVFICPHCGNKKTVSFENETTIKKKMV